MKSNNYPRICANCKWWYALCEKGDPDIERGSCRRRPPQIVYVRDEFNVMWPVVPRNEWCGEFAVMQHPRITDEGPLKFANAPTFALGA